MRVPAELCRKDVRSGWLRRHLRDVHGPRDLSGQQLLHAQLQRKGMRIQWLRRKLRGLPGRGVVLAGRAVLRPEQLQQRLRLLRKLLQYHHEHVPGMPPQRRLLLGRLRRVLLRAVQLGRVRRLRARPGILQQRCAVLPGCLLERALLEPELISVAASALMSGR